MSGGDRLRVDIHDTSAGLVTVIHDLTTGQVGSMTASVANGFAQVNYEPDPAIVLAEPVRVPSDVLDLERAHAGSVGGALVQRGLLGRDRPLPVLPPSRRSRAARAPTRGSEPDDDDVLQRGVLTARAGRRLLATDNDFDGTSYQPVWPGTNPNHGQDTKYHPRSVEFTSPVFNGTENYSRVAFEADLPRIEAADFGGNCNRIDGRELREPAAGRKVLSDLHDGQARQRLLSGTSAARISRARRTRSAATRPPSSGRSC